MRPRVLMVTGAYYPEASGASLQCRALIKALADRVDFAVLTTSTDPALPWQSQVDGVPVRRIPLEPSSVVSKAIAAERMASSMLELAGGADIIHFHGFSQKTVLLVAMARMLGKRIVIKLTSFGHDDPESIRARGRLAFWAYRQADRFVGVSPRFGAAFNDTTLSASRFRFIPNGVDVNRFRPAAPGEQAQVRAELGIPGAHPVVLFVGFFSPEKRPDVLYEAWARLAAEGVISTLVLVGATRGAYYEIDPAMADRIRRDATHKGLADRIVFVEQTSEIERYYRAADLFVLPTTREGLPNVLLESMASGLPPVITRLDGVTDWIVDDGVSGRLVPAQDRDALAATLRELLVDAPLRQKMGAAARRHVESTFGMSVAADRTLELYQDMLGVSGS